MNFLNKEKRDARWLTIVLGIFVAASYAFANLYQVEGLFRSMPYMFYGMELSGGYFALALIMGAVIKYFMFILFISLSYSIAYRSLVNRTRDIKVMPIAKESYTNHIQFVTIFANVIIGGICFAFRYNPLPSLVIGTITTVIVKLIAYLIALLLLVRVGIGDHVKEKVFGGFTTSLTVFAVLMI